MPCLDQNAAGQGGAGVELQNPPQTVLHVHDIVRLGLARYR